MANILQLWQRGNRGAPDFERVMRPHLPALYRLACRLTGAESDAEDLLQELLLRLLDRADEIGNLDRPDIWLSRVLYRLYVDEHRRSRLRPRPAADYRGSGPEDGDDPVTRAEAASDSAPEALAERAFESARLQRALDALSENQRMVVLLHDVEGYRLTELATLLDTPVGTLKSRLHRARRQLRELLSAGTF
jgi:RNA polymerase sigma-70 factor (ECF subfamily)